MAQPVSLNARKLYAALLEAVSGSDDPRFAPAIAGIPREDFLGPGPWKIMIGPQIFGGAPKMRYVETPSADPALIYQDVLVALDADRGVNNGSPFLHAQWIGAVAPKAGETVVHVGAGTGYYSAILARLVAPDGQVIAYEIDRSLADLASKNLQAYDAVSVTAGNAVEQPLPSCDILYINAGVAEPPAQWLRALNPRGRMVFPWSPAPETNLAVLITRTENGLAVRPLMPAWFIPCIGADKTTQGALVGDPRSAWRARSVHWKQDRDPDESALAVYDDFWISAETIPA